MTFVLALLVLPSVPSATEAGREAVKRTQYGPVAQTLPKPPIVALAAGEPFRYATAFGRARALFGDRADRSAGLRMESEDRWLEFELVGSEGSSVTAGERSLEFKEPAGRLVRYERTGNRVKEEIVLPGPSAHAPVFRFASRGLKRALRRDGYHFYDARGEELFRVERPVVFDAAGRRGGATLRIDGEIARIDIEKKFLRTASYPVTVDPTIVSTASQAVPAGLSINRHIVRSSNGTLVFFYQSGAGLQYKTSTNNGSSWSAATNVDATTSNEFDLLIANDDIYLAYRGTASNSVHFRKLSYAGGSSWTLGPSIVVESGGTEKRTPAIVQQSSGTLWVFWHHRLGANNTVRVRSSANDGATWSASTVLANIGLPDSCTAVLYRDRPAVVYELNSGSLQARFWNGSSWTAAQAIVSGDDYDDYNWGSLATTDDGRLHLAYAPQGGGYIRYTSFDGSSWSPALTLSGAGGDRYPSLSTDGSKLWLYWSRRVGPDQYKIVYRKYSGGAWSDSPTAVTGPEEDAFARVWLYSPSPGPGYSETLVPNEYVGQGAAQGWRADDQSWSYTLPFDFPFYDTTRTSVYVCSNGFLDFTSADAEWNNTTAEFASRVMIAGLWDDIRTDGAAQPGEDIYVYEPDAHSVVFRWVGQTYWTNLPVDFEIRLFDDGTIKFNYNDGNTGLSPTVGVSSGNGTRYLLSAYDGAASLTNVQTSLIQPAPPSGSWTDRTAEAASTATGDVSLFAANGDACYLGLPAKFDYVYFDLLTPAGASVSPDWHYWDGAGWQPLTLTQNPAYGFTASGRIEFDAPAAWQQRSLGGSPDLYFVRITRQAGSVLTPPVANQFTSVRNNVAPTTASRDTSSIPVGWSEGIVSPYTVRYDALPVVDITLSISETYDRDGTLHSAAPFGVNFGDVDPQTGQYTVSPSPGQYAVRTLVMSDEVWSLYAQASGDLLDADGNTIPIGNLKWAPDGSSSWSSFVKAPASAPILLAQPQNFPSGLTFDFDYQLNLGWTTTGSNLDFTTAITYTAVND
ncbi:MAG: hypothetical protein C4521_10320 [Actinobacteria bacterium]|nr:MAG: hypothetical protein C4521_10320 [Actinomycetota bacterium]